VAVEQAAPNRRLIMLKRTCKRCRAMGRFCELGRITGLSKDGLSRFPAQTCPKPLTIKEFKAEVKKQRASEKGM